VRAHVVQLGDGNYEYTYNGIKGEFTRADVDEVEINDAVLRVFAEKLAVIKDAQIVAKKAVIDAKDAVIKAEIVASKLSSLCNIISANPALAHDLSAEEDFQEENDEKDDKKSERKAMEEAFQKKADELLEMDLDTHAAKVALSRKAIPEPRGGTSFDDFVGKWQFEALNQGDVAIAETVEKAFKSMLAEPVGGTWSESDSVAVRLEDLKQYVSKASKRNFPRRFEIAVTRPFVFAVLKCAFPALKGLVASDSELHLYTENAGEVKNARLYGNADAALLPLNVGATNVQYDDTSRRFSLLVVEAKRALDTRGKRDALCGGERDFVWVSGADPSESMRAGTCLFTDGVSWYFARMAWRYSGIDRSWRREIVMSPEISLASEGGWSDLAKWFVFALRQAVDKPFESTGLSVCRWGSSAWRLVDMLSVGKRSVVARWRYGNVARGNDKKTVDVNNSVDVDNSVVDNAVAMVVDTGKAAVVTEGDTVIVKMIVGSDVAERNQQLSAFFEREREMLRQFAGSAAFVHLAANFPRCDTQYIAMCDGGRSLASFDISGTKGQSLAKLVVKDIWRGALVILAAAKLCHFDITQYNIVVTHDLQSAKLIDLESMTRIGESTAGSPTAVGDGIAGAKASEEFDKRSVYAVLKCLWDLSLTSFEKRKGFAMELSSDVEWNAFVTEIENPTEMTNDSERK
jgi:hypothetical protein